MFGGLEGIPAWNTERLLNEGILQYFANIPVEKETYLQVTYRLVNRNFYPLYFVNMFKFFSCSFSQKHEVLLVHTTITVFHLLPDTKMLQTERQRQEFTLRAQRATSNLFHGKPFSKVKVFFLLMLLTAIFALPA